MSSIKSSVSRRAIWESHVLTWQGSGLSKAKYCRENKLRYHQFIYWISKGEQRVQPKTVTAQTPKLLPVVIKQSAVSPELQIKLPNGIIISGITVDSVEVLGALMDQL
ncbi:IS66 family insertion sequence element accessory protein TnpA [Granulosicoccus antarcticus]|uniref:IS66 family insertion sequence element accessory protein TnpB n=1 Tax=Granulosicoccus antarcticus IMCC3135 TaxID=1192854 RepID=A0A2Z2NY88_9GAMM|nr:hypothetical protein [Granulosicoccus antarcticus]ASJ72114.1 hypothetical protein IMCC3135_10100 [Granulosicoccus antarcticus IMCC3135]